MKSTKDHSSSIPFAVSDTPLARTVCTRSSMAQVLFLLAVFSTHAFAESVIRNPVEFLQKALLDFSFGPGYTVGENPRRHNQKSGQQTGTNQSFFPLYDFRFGPANITNAYSQPNYTKGKRLRIGLLFDYTGDEYETDTINRKKTLFGGGFIGYNALTFSAYTDLFQKNIGTLYTIRYSPALIRSKAHEISIIWEGQHMNRPYVNYYFGVREVEATALIPAYVGVRTYNFSATLLYVYTINKTANFSIWGTEKYFGKGVTNSPTVGLRHQFSVGIGWLFKVL